jgi:hypothetical protein
MIADKSLVIMPMIVPVHPNVKVGQYKETREPEIPSPKRIRHPRIQIRVIDRRCIVGDHRGTLIRVIIVFDCGVRITGGSYDTGNLTRSVRFYRQPIPAYSTLKCF